MRNLGNRTIKVNKQDLIVKIEENKENHIKKYEKAVLAYKEEALKQLKTIKKDVLNGDLNVKLNLITPIDIRENYDKIIEMFIWEVEDFVELEQREFMEYVQDETEFSRQAKFSNMTYIG